MSKLHAYLLLLFAAALWGFGNVPQKTVLDHDPLSAVGMRCLIAALGAALSLGERISPAGALGATMMLGAILYLIISAGPGQPAGPSLDETP